LGTYRYTVPFIHSIQYGTYKVYNMHFIAGQPILAQTDTRPNIYTHAQYTPPAKVDTNFANKIRKSSSVHSTFQRMLKYIVKAHNFTTLCCKLVIDVIEVNMVHKYINNYLLV
jgi:hypothetical protein